MMSLAIRKAAVIGAGVMGAGIAAHFANAGIPVVLLDIPVDDPDRARLAREAVARQIRTGGFMHASLARQVTVGTTEQDLGLVADCDWVVEAVVESLPVKRDLYTRLSQVMKPGAVLSSNTSTIPLATLVEGLPDALARHFLITHFFNPPRHMRLLELISGPRTSPEAVQAVRDFADRHLGKSVVACKDTPGFLANRIGCYWMLAATHYAVELGLSVEEADAVISKPFGIPGTGIFGLTDLVGIDLMPKVWKSFADTLAATDAFHGLYAPLPAVDGLIARGTTGRKVGAGFFRKGKAGMEVVDLATLDYRPQARAQLASLACTTPRELMAHDDRGGRYAWAVMSATLSYAAALVPEISETIAPVDEAMRLGYNWEFGPFELIDRIGARWLAQKLTAEGRPVPPLLSLGAKAGGFYTETPAGRIALSPLGEMTAIERPAGIVLVGDFRRAGKPVQGNDAASLWDMGDGIACLEFHRKMNAIAPASLDALAAATARVASDFRALVIGNDAATFCAGADLRLFLQAIERGDRSFLDDFVRRGQQVYGGLKYAPFPVVGAVAGLALGGGCEILLHCDHIQAHAESAIGLVERTVGLIPAWGGCLQSLIRALDDSGLPKGPMPAPKAAFEVIVTAATSSSARHARDLRLMRPNDDITMNRERLMADAKAKALNLAQSGYRPPEPREFRLPGPSGRSTLVNLAETMVPLGGLKGHDLVVAGVLAKVLTGGADGDPLRPLSEQAILDLEREGFLELATTQASADRIAHMLATGKPLKN